MSDESSQPARSPTVRPDLLELLDRQGRRLGLASTLRNQLAAELVGLHPTDWSALDLLDSAGPLGIGELGRHLNLSPAAATGLVDRLERRGLVERRADQHDRRRTAVYPTPDRPPEFQDFDRELMEAMNEHAAGYSDEELNAVLRFMDGASTVLENAVRHRRAQSRAR